MCPGDSGVDKRIRVGVATKAVGLKGELKISTASDNPDRFAPGATLWMVDPVAGDPKLYTVRSSRHLKGTMVVQFDGITTIEQAEEYRGAELFVYEADVPTLPDGEYYYYQIIGLPVYTVTGRLLGHVDDIFPAGEKDVYVVKAEDGEEHCIPVSDEYVDIIDPKAGKITLRSMKGYIPD